jgi:uncharacterized protein (TIGR00299 family) protein
MRIAYLDCFAGISGDMLLGALLDAGVPLDVLQQATSALNVGATLEAGKVDRSGISCTKVHVLTGDTLAEHVHPHPPDSTAPTQGRPLSVILELIQRANLPDIVKGTAKLAFELLGASEARVHNIPLEQVHFHEVGAVDAIVDIVAASAAIHHLAIDAWYSSALNVGGGTVVCAHGTFPVPAPATADLLRGFPTYSAHVQKELVTPTGAALLRAIDPTFGPQPAMRVAQIGYGAGTRNPKEFPNALRINIGETATGDVLSDSGVTILETALDDLSPQLLAHVAESALAQGALDVMLTPVLMKKGRPGTLLTVLCEHAAASGLQELILRETTTLGIRVRREERVILERHHIPVATRFGVIRMKIGTLGGVEMNAAPEFEDCKVAAQVHSVAVKQVQQAAIAAYVGHAR